MVKRLGVIAACAVAPLILVTTPVAAAPPTADSGPDLVVEAGTNAVLAGAASDSDGDALQIRWLRSVVSGGDLTSCTFTGPIAFEAISPAGLGPAFNCTTAGQYLLQLVVADGTSTFDDLGALVTFTPATNVKPVVDSGPNVTTTVGADAQLAGSASDPDGDALEIRWIRSVVAGGSLASCTFTGPTSFQPISAAGLAPTINCSTAGEYLLQLVVGDGTTSVDDIGALVTFTDPVGDLSAPICSVSGAAKGGGYRIEVADPQSGVSAISAGRRINTTVSPGRARFGPAVTAATFTVRQVVSAKVGKANVRVTNGDGVSRQCTVVVYRRFVWVVNG